MYLTVAPQNSTTGNRANTTTGSSLIPNGPQQNTSAAFNGSILITRFNFEILNFLNPLQA
jgi:hypothetical protein